MIRANYHTHCSYCDGSGSPEDYIASALEKGFSAIGFTSHAPLPFPNDWTMNSSSLESYVSEINYLKKKYRDKIEIYTALEIDYIKNLMSPSDRKYTDLGLDYTIGSVHVLKDRKTGEYPGIDYTDSDIKQLLENNFNNDTRLLVEEYYETVRDMIKSGGFSILGHMDVIKKTNVNSAYFSENSSWYRKEAEKTVDLVKQAELILEVNTGNSRWQDETSIYPSQWILNMCFKADIPVILNADAHTPERIDAHFTEAIRLIKDAGYRKLLYFKNGSVIFEKI